MKKFIRVRSVLGAVSLFPLLSMPCGAQTASTTPNASMNPVVITANRQAQRMDEVIGSISIIERDEIERSGAGTLGDALARTAGVELGRQGGPGSAESIFIRGANGSHTLLLIDGVRVGSASLGTSAIEAIPLSQIQRVEILRGPGSALYGADAIGGVINVITKTSVDTNTPAVMASMGVGTQHTFKTHLATARKNGPLSYNISAGTAGSAGINALLETANPAYNPDRDGYQSRNLGFNAEYELDKNLALGGGYLTVQNRNRYDSYQSDNLWVKSNASLDYLRSHTTTQTNLYARFSPVQPWKSTLRVAEGRDADDQQSATTSAPNDYYRTTQRQYAWQNDVKLPVGNVLALYERLEQKLDSTSTYTLNQRSIDSYALGWSGRVDANRFQTNLRQDRNSQYGVRNSHYLGVGRSLNPEWVLAASYGTAFKAPTFNDLYFPYVPFLGGGNPNLKPEEASNREISLRYETGSIRGHLTHFDNRIQNLIQWADDGTGTDTWIPFNVAAARIRGNEFGLSIDEKSWLHRVNLTFQDPKDEQTGRQLTSRAKGFATLASLYRTPTYSVGAELRLVGERYYGASATTRMSGYNLLNLTAEYRLAKDWMWFGRVDNALDRQYAMAYTVSTPANPYRVVGRAVFVGVRYAIR